MIRKIAYLNDFGLYRDFQWSTIPSFARYNLIYGWNYSGKTTLSRLFQLIENPDRLASWPHSTFSIELEDGFAFTQENLPLHNRPKVRVFNREFVHLNFVQEHTAPAVFILGAETLELRRRKVVLAARCRRIEGCLLSLQELASHAQAEIDRLGTDKARDVGSLLADRAFRRPNLMQRVDEVRNGHTAVILSDDQVTAKIEICRTTSEWPNLNAASLNLPDWNVLLQDVNDLLSQTASNRAIERLRDNHHIESWVRAGLGLHQSGHECEYCGSAISDARQEQLKGHFSREYENLVQALDEKIRECQRLHLDITLPAERDFAPDLKVEFTELLEQIRSWKSSAKCVVGDLIDMITRKRTNIESLLVCKIDLTCVMEGVSLLEQVNVLIASHNQACNQLEQTKSEAKVAVERHFAAVFFAESDIDGKEACRDKAQKREANAQEIRQKLLDGISAIENQLVRQSTGVAKLNDLLRFLMSGNNIESFAIGDGLFEFRRNGVAAENLSDGERTAIAFAYFLISLEANDALLTDIIVFVDDPVSSLDSNHVYAVYALIVQYLSACLQVFISTHNGELFNLIKGNWFSARTQYKNNEKSHAYYVNRTLSKDAQWTTVLEDLPSLLRKYNSEYHFVFAQLYAFAFAQSPSLHEAYTAPNLLRKFLEAYLGFRKPSVSKWSDKLDLLGFATPFEQCEIQKFADDASHLQGISRALQQPNFVSTSQANVIKVINGLKGTDFGHYSSLCVVIGETP